MLDANMVLSEAQALTATAASTNYIDLGAAATEYGDGEPLIAYFFINTTLDSSEEDATLTITLQEDEVTTFNSALKTLVASAAIPEASCGADDKPLITMMIPGGNVGLVKRYIRAYYTVGTHNFTSGKITAYIRPYKG